MNNDAFDATRESFAREVLEFLPIYAGTERASAEHQFLFFAKPEMFDDADQSTFEVRMRLFFETLSRFELTIEKIVALSGAFLDKHGIMSEHYGVIDSIARDPNRALSAEGRGTFRSLFGHELPDTAVGGIQYLGMHPEIDPADLARAWLDRGFEKLSGGSYCQHLPEEDIYLFNAFYPQMLRHYTRASARIYVFVLRGSNSWKSVRDGFIGTTNPSTALAGSIRRELLDRKEELGMPVISANLNGAHLSAGPIEGLVELLRFTDDRTSEPPSPEAFIFGAQLRSFFSSEQVERLLGNPDLVTGGSTVSVFDLTEELDASDAIERLVELKSLI